MNIHFAGSDAAAAYNEILEGAGARNRLESFYTLGKKQPSTNFNLLLDSGGFVARTKGIVISVERYSKFINQYKVKLAFNLDTNDVDETLKNQEYLQKNCPGCYIIPIYHYSDYNSNNRELLQDFLSYPYIGLGGMVGAGLSNNTFNELLRYVFYYTQDKVRVHGLGMTIKSYMEKYPFYSVDSTSWLSAARYGNVTTTNNIYLAAYYKKKVHYLINTKREAKMWVRTEHYITELWKKRGLQWTELN